MTSDHDYDYYFYNLIQARHTIHMILGNLFRSKKFTLQNNMKILITLSNVE